MYCPNCSKEQETGKFCLACGGPLLETYRTKTTDEKKDQPRAASAVNATIPTRQVFSTEPIPASQRIKKNGKSTALFEVLAILCATIGLFAIVYGIVKSANSTALLAFNSTPYYIVGAALVFASIGLGILHYLAQIASWDF